MPGSYAMYDIVVVGAGPTGLLLSACLARWGYKIKHIDIRPQATTAGRADGIQPRSLDLLCNMGLKAEIMAQEPGSFRDVAFWDPDPSGFGIHRTGSWASCPESIRARYPFTTTLHQGLIEDVLIRDLEGRGVHIQRPWRVSDFSVDTHYPGTEYPVHVTIQNVTTGAVEEISSKYLFSGEGAKSSIREKLGIQMFYNESRLVNCWGVIDARVSTNFPDVKLKCNIHSEAGSMMIIPRERSLIRFYVQLAAESSKTSTLDDMKNVAGKVLAPFEIEWEYVDWFSCYKVAQGIAGRYSSDSRRVFLGGDACHVHSPKAGQGMNTGFLDAQNLAWKIHAVERGFASRSILTTYESERMQVAKKLLDFDASYSKLFSEPQQNNNGGQSRDNDFVKIFRNASEFTSGYGVSYPPNDLNIDSSHHSLTTSPLFMKYPAETRLRGGFLFPAVDATRVIGGSIVNLEQAVPFNGAYRIYVFGGQTTKPAIKAALADFAWYSLQQDSYYSSFSPVQNRAPSRPGSHHSHLPVYTFCTILAVRRSDVDIDRMVPELLASDRTQIYVDEVGEDAVDEGTTPYLAHRRIGTTANKPAVVVVRPDGYVGCTVKLVEGSATVDALNAYFGRFTTGNLGPQFNETIT